MTDVDHSSSPELAHTATGTRAESGEADSRQWWWSRDEERFYGPSHSRADAIMDAWADDPEQGAWLTRANQGEWRHEIVDSERLQELFDDANEEQSDPDGDPPSTSIPAAEWERAATAVRHTIRSMIRRTGSLSWGFTHQSGNEWINIPAMWVAAEKAAAEEVARDR